MTPALESNRRAKPTQIMDASEKRLNNVTIHETINQLITLFCINLVCTNYSSASQSAVSTTFSRK